MFITCGCLGKVPAVHDGAIFWLMNLYWYYSTKDIDRTYIALTYVEGPGRMLTDRRPLASCQLPET